MAESDTPFINVQLAHDFANACPDPVVREVLWTAYGTLLFRMAGERMVGTLDVHFFFKVLAKMMDDRDRLGRVLAGDFSDI